jgi:hypothetical protein
MNLTNRVACYFISLSANIEIKVRIRFGGSKFLLGEHNNVSSSSSDSRIKRNASSGRRDQEIYVE